MATKKKTKKNTSNKIQKKVKLTVKVAKKKALKKLTLKKHAAPKKRPIAKASAKRAAKPVAKAAVQSAGAKTPARPEPARRIGVRGKREIIDTVSFDPEDVGARSAGQSGDLQGISNVESADSESVDELLEEGNAFEAGVIKGIQDAPDPDEAEVTTHEVPEDDVPGEYTDEDRPGRG